MKQTERFTPRLILDRVNKFAESVSVTKTQFAERVGLPEPKWNKISNGKQKLDFITLAKIAEAYGKTIMDVIDYPNEYIIKDTSKRPQFDRVSVTFEVSPENREILTNLITQKNN